MKLSRLFSITLALVLVISLTSIWFQSSVQDFMEGNTTWNGVKDFVSAFDVTAVDSLGSLDSPPDGSVLIAIPNLSYSDIDLARIAQFLNGGGTLLLMNDFGYGNAVLQYLNMDVRFARGVLLDPLFCYKNPELPKIVSFPPSAAAEPISAITFDRSTSLVNVGNGEVLASSSDLSFMDLNGNGTWDSNEPKGPFAVAAKYRLNAGSVALLTDPSMIINSMLTMDENSGFMRYLTSTTGEGKIYLDRSHLIKSPLDIAKLYLLKLRKMLSNPYAATGVLALVFVLVALNVKGKENPVD